MIYSAEKLRSFLLLNYSLENITSITGKAFKEAGVETIILSVKKEKPINNIINLFINKDGTKDFILLNSSEQEYYCNNDGYELNLFANDETKHLIEKISEQSDKLESLCNVRAGLQAYEKGKGTPKQTADEVENRPYDFLYKYNEDTFRYLEGSDVRRYSIAWSGNWLWYGKHLAAPRKINLFNAPRIIVREITGSMPKSIISTYCEETYLFNRSNICILNNDSHAHISLKYIVAILNSKLMSFYFLKNTAKAERKLYPKIILNDLKQFPIKDVGKEKIGRAHV